jgi:hypothetical protein
MQQRESWSNSWFCVGKLHREIISAVEIGGFSTGLFEPAAVDAHHEFCVPPSMELTARRFQTTLWEILPDSKYSKSGKVDHPNSFEGRAVHLHASRVGRMFLAV